MKRILGTFLVVAAVGFVGGLRIARQHSRQSVAAGTATHQTAPIANPRSLVSVANEPTKGDANALVTIVEFGDFESRFCAIAEEALARIRKEYPNKGIRVVWKDAPDPAHHGAILAAEAARAAAEQGRFWEMHDRLLEQTGPLDMNAVERFGRELGLDVNKLRASIEQHRAIRAIEADRREAAQLDVRGTPTFFIDGRRIRGIPSWDVFQQTIDAELELATVALGRGISPARLYDELLKSEIKPTAAMAEKSFSPFHDPKGVYKAEIGQSPVLGSDDALVTIVTWSDFQCPYCARLDQTLKDIEQLYGKRVRFVWKNSPLEFHTNARPAAEAALAAKEQGKFWEYHDLLFQHQEQLDQESLEQYARDLKLDMAKFDAALKSHKYAAQIDADTAAGRKLGVKGTPCSFINGKYFNGAKPVEAFRAKIDEELHVAKPYAELMTSAIPELPTKPEPLEPVKQPKPVVHIDIARSNVKGPANAPVTIVEYADYYCHFCRTIETPISRLLREYPGKVRLVWKDFPLSLDRAGTIAARAANAASEQGRFWQMHDKLMTDPTTDPKVIERHARELRLNVERFMADFQSNKYDALFAENIGVANQIAIQPVGVPTVFIAGRQMPAGASFEAMKKMVDDELGRHLALR